MVRRRRQRPRPAGQGPQGGRRAARPRGLRGGLRPGAHLRQPLRLLLHLPAAQGHAPQPLPEGRRLPPLLPLRELHDPHPLHRARRRAGDRRAPRAPCSSPSTPPTRRCAPAMLRNPKGRDQPALAARPARGRASRSTARSSCAPASTTGPCSRTRSSASSTSTPGSPRSASSPSGSAGSPTSRTCGRTRRAEAAAVLRHGGRVAGALPHGPRPAPRLPGRRVLPDGRARLPAGRHLRRLPPARERHRDGSGLPRRLRRRPAERARRAGRLLRLGRRRARRGLPGPDHWAGCRSPRWPRPATTGRSPS